MVASRHHEDSQGSEDSEGKTMGQRVTQVDAFTATPFAGNPAAVCVLPEPGDADWMQRVAREMNLAETAFLHRQADGFNLRWFTPAVEVDLCGHATLASAHVLWEEGHLRPDEPARFHTRSGLLTATRQEGQPPWIELDFPTVPAAPADAPADLVEALRVADALVWVGKSQFDYLVEVDSEATLRALAPNYSRLEGVPVRGVIVTCRSVALEYDFVSRFFAPRVGVNEDPVTGSAHATLAPFWGQRLGQRELVAYQASPRGGTLRVQLNGDRVAIAGQAVTVMRGELLA
jgi:PhzF family phenazine biosynthesis protein